MHPCLTITADGCCTASLLEGSWPLYN